MNLFFFKKTLLKFLIFFKVNLFFQIYLLEGQLIFKHSLLKKYVKDRLNVYFFIYKKRTFISGKLRTVM